MIRKFFATLVLTLFVSLLPPMLIVESFVRGFLSESSLSDTVVPGSYYPLTALLADQFARSEADRALFEERIRTVISQETYAELLQAGYQPLFAQLEGLNRQNQLLIDLMPLKEKMRQVLPDLVKRFPDCGPYEESGEEFRFCKPRKMPDPARFKSLATDIIDKQVPPRLRLGSEENPQAMQIVHGMVIAKKYLLEAALVAGLFFLGLVALIIFSPLYSVLLWLGSSLLLLETLLGLFAYSLARLPDLIPVFKEASVAEIGMAKFLISSFTTTFSLWLFAIGTLSVLFLGAGIIFKYRKA